MAKRSHEDWTNLIQQQPSSGLTITIRRQLTWPVRDN